MPWCHFSPTVNTLPMVILTSHGPRVCHYTILMSPENSVLTKNLLDWLYELDILQSPLPHPGHV